MVPTPPRSPTAFAITRGRYPGPYTRLPAPAAGTATPAGRAAGSRAAHRVDGPPRWSSSPACAHAVVVSVLTPAEVLIAARRLAGVRPHLAAVAGIVHPEDMWRLCRDELTGADVRIDGWNIHGRWFGVVVGATPRTGELQRGETIPWRVIAAQLVPASTAARADRSSRHDERQSELPDSGKIPDEKLELACCGNPYRAVQNRAVQSFCLVTAEQPRPDRQALGLRSTVTLSDYRSRGERAHCRRSDRISDKPLDVPLSQIWTFCAATMKFGPASAAVRALRGSRSRSTAGRRA